MKTVRPIGRKNLKEELRQFGYHLVYSEGTKTEPNYVRSIKKSIANKYNCSPNEIHLVTANIDSYNTIGLVQYALDDVSNKLRSGDRIDHVWIMFDKDSFPEVDFNNANSLINSQNNSPGVNSDGFHYNKENNISWHSCWTNEAFELWLCLYFSYYHVPHTRDDYIKYLRNNKKLTSNGIKYEKNLEDIHQKFEECGGSIENAIKYAKKLTETNGYSNPSTGMYIFAEYFKPYMEHIAHN